MVFLQICAFMTILATIAGGIVGSIGIISTASGPQQLAAAAVGLFIAGIPYIFTRCVSMFVLPSLPELVEVVRDGVRAAAKPDPEPIAKPK